MMALLGVLNRGGTNPTTITLIRISAALGVSVAEFFSEGFEADLDEEGGDM